MVELDLALHVRQHNGVLGVDDLRLRVQHLDDALAAGHRALELRVLQHEVAHRIEEVLHVERERDDDADGERAVQHPEAAEDDDQRRRD